MTHSGNYFKDRRRKEQATNTLSTIGIVLMAAGAMLPLWWIFRSSLMTNAELYAYPPAFFPQNWRFANYAETLEHFPFWTYLKNTLTIVVPSVLAGTSTAVLCGYAFARLRFPGKNIIFAFCVGSMLLPNMVTLIPLYLAWTRLLGVRDSYLPLILPHFFGGGAFNIFLIRQFIKTIPRELDEAATIDGANRMQILAQIIVPSIKPAIIVVALLQFIFLWNDMLQQLVYINSPGKFTMALGLTIFRGALRADWSRLMAATCMSFIPGLIFYLVGQKHLVEGIVMTGMKN